jgi:hypothetical protein
MFSGVDAILLCRVRNCLRQLYAKDITADEKQELDEALQREVKYPKFITWLFGMGVSVYYMCPPQPFNHSSFFYFYKK